VFANTGLAGSAGLAFNGGSLEVANYNNNSIEVFDFPGHGSMFSSPGLFHPIDVAFDADGNMYVVNTGNMTIEKLDSNGNGSVFASNMNFPQGLAYDSSGSLYVTNWTGNTIGKFDANGNGSVFASTGLSSPGFIAVQVPEPTTARSLASAY
jgi:streptogramin lyase